MFFSMDRTPFLWSGAAAHAAGASLAAARRGLTDRDIRLRAGARLHARAEQRSLRRQLADAEARNQELEQRCAQLKVQADEYESLKDHVAQIEISAHRRTEQFREEAVTQLRQLAARQREWCRTAQADYEQMNCQLLERLQQAEQTLRQPDMSSFRRMEEGLTALEKGLTAPEKAGE